MKMRFYDALQLDPSLLKRKIAACGTPGEKAWYWTAIALRSVLIVVFAIVFISLLSGIFGADNTPMGVALFCMMLGIRFVNFEYCMKDSLLTLGAALGILVLAPAAAAACLWFLLIPLHFLSFFALMCTTTQRPEMGNGGIYTFAYIYLTGNPVAGEALVRRGLLALFGYLICGAILYAKHKGRHKDVRFHEILRKFRLSRPVCLWQLWLALGVSLLLSLGQILGIPRFMWVGFAGASLLSQYPDSGSVLPRFWQRIAGTLGGCALFALLYVLTPETLRSLLGPLGGLCMGFCTDYRYKTAMNCLGALMIGAGIYGMPRAVGLRILDALLGVVLGLLFAAAFQHLAANRLLPAPEAE